MAKKVEDREDPAGGLEGRDARGDRDGLEEWDGLEDRDGLVGLEGLDRTGREVDLGLTVSATLVESRYLFTPMCRAT
ncbi:MAG: hypothetical protein ABIJ00_07495 [Candidatus Eisenbacteria bacterium]